MTSSLSWTLAVAASLSVPVVMSLHGQDPFRLPKDLLFFTLAIGIAAASIGAWLRGRNREPQSSSFRAVPLMAVAAVAWTALTSLFSTNHSLSNRAILWVVAVAVFACAVDLGGRTRTSLSIAWPLLPAAVNAGVFLLQRFHWWNPMTFPADVPDHIRYTALVGNPDDVGSMLVAPTLVAIALVLCDRERRVLWIPTSALLLLAIGTGRLTSLVACAAGLLVMGFMRSRRERAIAATLLVAVGIALIAGDAPLRKRIVDIATALRAHDYPDAMAGRVTPFLSAAMMARDHPLAGVGPGCFRWRYFDYKLAAERAHPSLARSWAAGFNFGEAHNDHLQTLAETGVPGYGLFVLAIVVLGASSRRKPEAEQNDETQQDDIVRTLALPLAVAISVLCLAHFPLHLAASTVVIIYIATLCVAWGPHAEVNAFAIATERAAALARPRRLPALFIAAGLIVVVISAALLIWRLAWEPWQCNVMKNEIQARTSRAYDTVVDPFRTSQSARANLTVIELCLKAVPDDVALYMLAAANDRLIGRSDEAASMYRKALQYDRRPELYYNLGIVELELNQRHEAIGDLLAAVCFSRTYLQDLPADVQNEINDALRQRYPYLAGR